MIGDPEALADHPLQVDPAPAHDPVYGPVRTRLDEFRQFGPLLRREARLGSLGPAVQKTVRTVCVEPMHPARSICRSIPPIRAASVRFIPSTTAASESRRRLWLAFFVVAANRRSSVAE